MDESEETEKSYSDAEIKEIVAEGRRVLAEAQKMMFGDMKSVKRADMDSAPMDTYAALRKAGWDG